MNKEQAQKLLKRVKEDYVFGSECFASRTNPWESIFELVKKWVGNGQRVLDVGCGDGRYFEALKDKKANYVGVDNCEALIKKTRKYENRKTKFLVGDILDLPFGDNQFDYVLCIAVLHHIPSRELQLKALCEMRRVLKPGGKLIMTNWMLLREIYKLWRIVKLLHCYIVKRNNCLGLKNVLVPWGITGNKINRYYYAFSLAELKRLVKKVGFRIDRAYYMDRKKKTSFWRSYWKRGNIVVVAKK